jgi:hypothetical protein
VSWVRLGWSSKVGFQKQLFGNRRIILCCFEVTHITRKRVAGLDLSLCKASAPTNLPTLSPQFLRTLLLERLILNAWG